MLQIHAPPFYYRISCRCNGMWQNGRGASCHYDGIRQNSCAAIHHHNGIEQSSRSATHHHNGIRQNKCGASYRYNSTRQNRRGASCRYNGNRKPVNYCRQRRKTICKVPVSSLVKNDAVQWRHLPVYNAPFALRDDAKTLKVLMKILDAA